MGPNYTGSPACSVATDSVRVTLNFLAALLEKAGLEHQRHLVDPPLDQRGIPRESDALHQCAPLRGEAFTSRSLISVTEFPFTSSVPLLSVARTFRPTLSWPDRCVL